MKTLLKTLMTVALLFATTLIYAQAPDAFNYQAVIRDGSDNLVATQTVDLRFSVLDGSATGTSLYRETEATTTNQYGLVNHAVGTGTVDAGSWGAINWASGIRYLKTEVSIAGGPYRDMGAQQLVSVPYALDAQHAATADNVTNNNWVGGSTVISMTTGTGDYVISHAMPATWGVTNTLVIANCSDARTGHVIQAYVSTTPNIHLKIVNDSGSAGTVRINYVVIPF